MTADILAPLTGDERVVLAGLLALCLLCQLARIGLQLRASGMYDQHRAFGDRFHGAVMDQLHRRDVPADAPRVVRALRWMAAIAGVASCVFLVSAALVIAGAQGH